MDRACRAVASAASIAASPRRGHVTDSRRAPRAHRGRGCGGSADSARRERRQTSAASTSGRRKNRGSPSSISSIVGRAVHRHGLEAGRFPAPGVGGTTVAAPVRTLARSPTRSDQRTPGVRMATDERIVVEFDQHTPEYRETYPAKAHELREQCPVAWSTKHDGFWVVTGHDELSALSEARRPAVERPRSERRAQRLPGHLDPRARHHAGRLHRDGSARAVGVPADAEPVPLPRGRAAVAAAHRRLHPGVHRRRDRDRPARLRRRLRQRRARRPHDGDARPAAHGLGDLLRTGAHAGVHGPGQSRLRPHARDDLPHGRTVGGVRADPQDRAPSRA